MLRSAPLLLVEPSATVAAQLREGLAGCGYQVETVEGGPEAASRLRDRRFDLVLSGTELPGFSGYELCRLIRTLPAARDTAVVLLCGFDEPFELIRALGCGADGVAGREGDPSYLAGRLAAVVASKRRRGLDAALRNGAGGPAEEPGGDESRLRDFLLWMAEETGRALRLGPADGASRARAELAEDAPLFGPPADPQLDRRRVISQLATGLLHQIANPVGIVVLNQTALRERVFAMRDALVNASENNAEALFDLYRHCLAELEEIIDDDSDGLSRVQTTLGQLAAFSGLPRKSAGPRAGKGSGDGSGDRATGNADEFDLNEIVTSVAGLARPLVEARAHLELDLRPVPPLRGDGVQLADGMWALLQWVGDRLLEVDEERPRVLLTTRTQGRHALLAVQYAGVAADDERRSWSEAAPTGRARRPTGSGLGLAICRETVAAIGGTLRVFRDPGPVNRIEVVLPISQSGPEPVAPPEKPRDAGARRLLIVDDEPNLLKAYKRVLSDYEVHTAEGGVAALSLLAKDRDFDVLLIDLMMPDLDGKQVYESLRERAPALLPRIVFCSGGVFTRRMEAFIQSVQNPFLTKPIAPDDLREAIRKLPGR